MWPRGASASRHTSAPAGTKVGHIKRYALNSVRRRQSPEPCRSSPTLTPSRAEGRDKTAKHCQRDKNNHGTELAMKVVRQARLELSGGSTPDQLRPGGRAACHKAGYVCLLVVPGIRTDLGLQEETVCIVCPQTPGKRIFGRWEWDVCPCAHRWRPPCFTFNHSHGSEVWRMLTTSDVASIFSHNVRGFTPPSQRAWSLDCRSRAHCLPSPKPPPPLAQPVSRAKTGGHCGPFWDAGQIFRLRLRHMGKEVRSTQQASGMRLKAGKVPLPPRFPGYLHKSQYPLGFLNPKDLNSPGPVAVARTGDL